MLKASWWWWKGMRAVWKEEDLLKGMELVKNLLLLGMMDVS
jgi:hypothetical protein